MSGNSDKKKKNQLREYMNKSWFRVTCKEDWSLLTKISEFIRGEEQGYINYASLKRAFLISPVERCEGQGVYRQGRGFGVYRERAPGMYSYQEKCLSRLRQIFEGVKEKKLVVTKLSEIKENKIKW